MELGKLEIYQLALKLSDIVWDIYNTLPQPLQFNIGNQIIRSVDSIGANIAEGYGRFHYRENFTIMQEDLFGNQNTGFTYYIKEL